MDRDDPFIKKTNPMEAIAKGYFILAMVLVLGYFILTVKAVMAYQHQYKEQYRTGRIDKDQYDQLMQSNTCLKMLISPEKVYRSFFQ